MMRFDLFLNVGSVLLLFPSLLFGISLTEIGYLYRNQSTNLKAWITSFAPPFSIARLREGQKCSENSRSSHLHLPKFFVLFQRRKRAPDGLHTRPAKRKKEEEKDNEEG
ncbi:MAG: hypothetical protein JW829_20215 [Pirellulales bacterium]|nr:hypothetical protein [Pirellulales bacterium]